MIVKYLDVMVEEIRYELGLSTDQWDAYLILSRKLPIHHSNRESRNLSILFSALLSYQLSLFKGIKTILLVQSNPVLGDRVPFIF